MLLYCTLIVALFIMINMENRAKHTERNRIKGRSCVYFDYLLFFFLSSLFWSYLWEFLQQLYLPLLAWPLVIFRQNHHVVFVVCFAT